LRSGSVSSVSSTSSKKGKPRDEWGEFPDSEDSTMSVNPVYADIGGSGRSMFGNSMDDTSLASSLAAEFGALAANKPEDEVMLEDTTNPMLAEIDRPSVEVIPAENPKVTKVQTAAL